MEGEGGLVGGLDGKGGWGGEKGTDPNVEVEVLVRDGFDVEADCRDGGDDFADLWLPQRPSIPRFLSSCGEEGRPVGRHTLSRYRSVVLPALS